MHTATLDYTALLSSISWLLDDEGSFSVLLPHTEFQTFRRLAESAGYPLRALLNVRQTPAHAAFRSVGIFGAGEVSPEEELIIHDEQRQYTPAFSALLQPYYLHL